MSCTSLLERAAESSPAKSLGIAVSAQLKATQQHSECLPPASVTGHCQHSPSFQTSAPLMLNPTGDELTSWLEAFPVRRTAAHLEDGLWRTISGRKCGAWWQMPLPGTYLPRTSTDAPLTGRQTSLSRWVTPSDAFPLPRRTWVQTTYGNGIGYLHTPTCTANYAAPSMQKHACARAFVQVFGAPSPTNHEWLMGWPTGWTASEPLETGKFQSWLRLHSECLPQSLEAETA